MRLEKLNLKESELTKSELGSIKGGTTTTRFCESSYCEIEQEYDKETGEDIGDPFETDFPDRKSSVEPLSSEETME
ncbi:MAG: hypothetical protein QM654_00760 [Dysgonamonadaceae bacterium]